MAKKTKEVKNEPYPIVTVRRDKCGHLEIWEGNIDPGLTWLLTPDLYIQLESDVQAILDCLPLDEADDLDRGWTIHTHFISDEYFAVEA